MGGCGSTSGPAHNTPIADPNEFTFVEPDHRIEEFWKVWHAGREMGTGASCRVLRVHKKDDTGANKKEYACKEMVRDDEWNPRLFQTEHDILTRVMHDNIVKYETAWIDRKNFYILNELCTGGELFERIHKSRKFSEKKAAEILKDIIGAIGFCHTKNVVHRDLKPENIVYSLDEQGKDKLVIIDFGDAKIVSDTELYNEFVGTAFYLPPEIIRDRKGWELKASDMWSIGIIAYVLMTGRPPFHGKSHKDILKNIIKQDLKFPKNQKLSDDAKSFVRKLCNKQTRRRWTSEQALKHKFLTGGSSQEVFVPDVMLKLQSYHKSCLLKRVLVKLGTETLQRSRKDLLLKAFNSLDDDGTGKVTKKNLVKFLLKYDIDQSSANQAADSILEDLGNKDKIMKAANLREGAVAYDLSVDETIKKTFRQMSRGDKFVSKNDLSKYFHNRVDDKNLAQMLEEIDLDKDGKISFDEFSIAMKCPLQAHSVLKTVHERAQKKKGKKKQAKSVE